MQAMAGAALMLLQDDPGQMAHDIHLIMIFTGILAIAVLVVVVVLLVAAIGAAGLAGRAFKSADALNQRVGPLLDKVNELTIEFVPKLRTISDNVEHISTVVRGKMAEVSGTVTQVNQTVQQVNETVQQVNQTVRDANDRARRQVARADTIVSDAVTATQDISHKVQHTIRVPVRQVAGIIAAFKAGLETLIERSPFSGGNGFGPRGGVPPAGSVPPSGVPREPGGPYDV